MKVITTPPRVLALTEPFGSHVIELYDLATFRFEGYLKAFDPEFRDGVGAADITAEIVDALRFKSFEAATACWRMQSETRPIRQDGKPNRPLTHYTASITRVS